MPMRGTASASWRLTNSGYPLAWTSARTHREVSATRPTIEAARRRRVCLTNAMRSTSQSTVPEPFSQVRQELVPAAGECPRRSRFASVVALAPGRTAPDPSGMEPAMSSSAPASGTDQSALVSGRCKSNDRRVARLGRALEHFPGRSPHPCPPEARRFVRTCLKGAWDRRLRSPVPTLTEARPVRTRASHGGAC